MPGFVLTTGATVTCLHAGRAQSLAPSARVRAQGEPVITRTGPWVVLGCALPPPPTANGPCVTAQWITAALRVRVEGAPLLLQDSQAICTPTATGLIVVATQPRVRAE